MAAIDAIVFDLYGTLLVMERTLLHREVPRLLGVPRRAWIELVRSRLLTSSFADAATFCRFVCRSLAGSEADRLVEGCLGLVEAELGSVRLAAGALPLLGFLRRRGIRLALASNVSSVHTAPLARFGLDALFDAMALSCDDGRTKPDPEVYLGLCRRLGTEPSRTLFVGDSPRNDVEVPRGLGLQAIRVGGEAGWGRLGEVSELGLLALTGPDPLRPLLAVGQTVPLAGRDLRITRIRPVSEDAQGRYNLVYRVAAEEVGQERAGAPCTLYAKRYLSAGSAPVEAFVYGLQGMAGLPTCAARMVGEEEPLLLVSEARGDKYAGVIDPAIAREIGRHFAFGYVFSNADLRPRNAFLAHDGGQPRMTMVDLELCLLNLAIDVAELPDPTQPDAIDALGGEALRRLVKRRVLTDRTLPRARGEFFDVRVVGDDVRAAFGDGFLATYATLKERSAELVGAIRERLHARPHLVIGTSSYRRAMASIDLEDIRARLAEEPALVLGRLLAAGR